MSQTKPRRGRPKGSGIDDRARLRQLAALLRDDPALKPTTAIRAMGVKDPSAIRRLRDKFNACRREIMGELEPLRAPATASAPAPTVRLAAAPARRALAAAHAAPTRRVAPLGASVSAPPEASRRPADIAAVMPASEPLANPVRRREFDPVGGEWMTAWCGIGLQAMTSAVAAQVEFTQQVVRLPPMTAALRHHLALSELAFAFYASGARVAAAR